MEVPGKFYPFDFMGGSRCREVCYWFGWSSKQLNWTQLDSKVIKLKLSLWRSRRKPEIRREEKDLKKVVQLKGNSNPFLVAGSPSTSQSLNPLVTLNSARHPPDALLQSNILYPMDQRAADPSWFLFPFFHSDPLAATEFIRFTLFARLFLPFQLQACNS